MKNRLLIIAEICSTIEILIFFMHLKNVFGSQIVLLRGKIKENQEKNR